MKTVIISSDKWKNKCREDQFLLNSLLNNGIECEIKSWQENIDWAEYELLILRSPWDYYERYEDFCDWLHMLEKNSIRIANGARNILCNTDKQQQFIKMSDCEVPLIPYYVANSVSEAIEWYENSNYDKVVIKPSISASGHNTYLIDSNSELFDKLQIIMNQGHCVIMQPFVKNIERGEISLVYFHGVFSHGVLRYPGIIGARKKAVLLTEIDDEWLLAGEKICRYIGAKSLLYVRIDLVMYRDKITIMEIEMSEPDLYLTLDSEGTRIKHLILEIEKEMKKTL